MPGPFAFTKPSWRYTDSMSESHAGMTSHRPYLLRALYEWIADNGMTPHLLVDATRPHVKVPSHAVKEGRIVLNVAERAVAGLEMSNEVIRFNARFGGVSHAVSVPVSAVLAIYARETGQGMALPEDGPAGPEAEVTIEADAEDTSTTPLSVVPNEAGPEDDGDRHPPGAPRRGGHLRVVK